MTTARPTPRLEEPAPRRHRATLARSFSLLAAFRKEQSDPEFFYGLLARDTVEQLSAYTALDGATVVDVGSGPGFLARALQEAGARCVGLDNDLHEINAHGAPPANTIAASALAMPFRTGSADVCLSSNALEHVPDPWRMADEMVRVTRPGGVVYISFTNWLSFWGGHETSPWHYLGGERAARRYERKNGHPPKNRYMRSLYPVSVADALAWARSCREVEVLDAIPRYHPRWAQGIVRVPGLREVATWNLVLILRKLPGTRDE
jgi:SAM-dependent methyltransferase